MRADTEPDFRAIVRDQLDRLNNAVEARALVPARIYAQSILLRAYPYRALPLDAGVSSLVRQARSPETQRALLAREEREYREWLIEQEHEELRYRDSWMSELGWTDDSTPGTP